MYLNTKLKFELFIKNLINKKTKYEYFFKHFKERPFYQKIEFQMLTTSYLLFIMMFIHSLYVTLTFPIIEFFVLLICKHIYKYRNKKIIFVFLLMGIIYLCKSFISLTVFGESIYINYLLFYICILCYLFEVFIISSISN